MENVMKKIWSIAFLIIIFQPAFAQQEQSQQQDESSSISHGYQSPSPGQNQPGFNTQGNPTYPNNPALPTTNPNAMEGSDKNALPANQYDMPPGTAYPIQPQKRPSQ